MLVAKIKIWLAIQLVKSLEVSPRHPKRFRILPEDAIDDALCALRDNNQDISG